MDNILKGRVFLLGDNVDTDQILPGYAMSFSEDKLGRYALAGSELNNFAEKVQPGDFIVAGRNFGCGSSREQAPLALKNAGIAAIVAVSYAMIFRRNAINIGLPVLCGDLVNNIKEGDLVEIAIPGGRVFVPAQDANYKLEPLSKSAWDTIQAGGLINKVKKILADRGASD